MTKGRSVKRVAEKGLNEAEQIFVREYLLHFGKARAAVAAGFSTRTAKEQGYQIMQRPHVRAAVDKALAERAKRLDASGDEVLREIMRLAMFDPASLINVTSPEDIAQLPEDVRRAIVGWSWDRQGNFIVKLAKEGALEMLAKHFGLYEADNRQKPPGAAMIGVIDVSGLSTEVLAAIMKAKDAAVRG